MKNNKGNSQLMILIAALVLILLAVFYFANQKNTQTTPTTQSQSTIENTQGLDAAASELDATDVDSVDTSLNQNDTDAASF
ncbi:MAG: hypothetical protein WD988_01585 [Candidatus Curtissbacteria bacterium]